MHTLAWCCNEKYWEGSRWFHSKGTHPWHSAVCILLRKILATTSGKHRERIFHPTPRKEGDIQRLSYPWFTPIATNSSHPDTENCAIPHGLSQSFNSLCRHRNIGLITKLQKSYGFPTSNFHSSCNMNCQNHPAYFDIYHSESKESSFIIFTHESLSHSSFRKIELLWIEIHFPCHVQNQSIWKLAN